VPYWITRGYISKSPTDVVISSGFVGDISYGEVTHEE
jgi:hypothetical protein